MEKSFWVFVICVELVAFKPNWGSQATANSGNQPQNLAWQQNGYQYPVRTYSAQQQYPVPPVGNPYASYWPKPSGSSAYADAKAYAQQPVSYSQPQNKAAVVQNPVTPNQYVPQQVYTPPQVPQLTYPVSSNVPVHYGSSAKVQVLHETPQWLYQHYPNLFKPKEAPKAVANSNVYQIPKQQTPVVRPIIRPIPQNYVATAAAAAAAATAGGRPGSKPPVARATATATAGQPGPKSPVAPPPRAGAPLATPPGANVTTTPVPPTTTTPVANVTTTPAPPAVANANAIAGPGTPTANAIATASTGASANVTATVLTTPSPLTIPPPIAKAIKVADETKKNTAANSTALTDALQAVVHAAKKAVNAKSPVPFNVNSTVLSRNPDLNYLRIAYKDAQDQIKPAYAVFRELQDKINDLVQLVQDNVKAPPPSTAAQPTQDSQIDPTLDEENASPEANAENPDTPAASPEANDENPDAPAASPEANAENPDAPAASPEANSENPDAPAASPEANAENPDAPAASPEANAENPDDPAASPEANAENPNAPAASPEANAENPDAPAASPEANAENPDAPAAADEEPAEYDDDEAAGPPAEESS